MNRQQIVTVAGVALALGMVVGLAMACGADWQGEAREFTGRVVEPSRTATRAIMPTPIPQAPYPGVRGPVRPTATRAIMLTPIPQAPYPGVRGPVRSTATRAMVLTLTPARLYFPFLLSDPQNFMYLPMIRGVRPTPTPTASPTATFTPVPTPTPTPPWPEGLKQPGRSKLGLHVQWNNSPDIMEFIRRTKPAVVKSVGDLGFLAEVKSVSPSTVTIGRLHKADQRLDGDPIQAARAFVAENLEQYQLNPAVDYWEGYNEPGVHGRMAWYAAFEAERVRVMAQHGFRTAVGGFSAGVPEWEDFAAFLPAIEAAQKHGGIFTVHEYDAPTMDRSMGAGLPGRPDHADRGALTLRYRWWYEDFLKPRGLGIPLVVSEAGIDGGIGGRPGPAGLGWRDFIAYWASHGLGKNGPRVYVRQLAWYDAELQRDDYVIGFTVFTAGAISDQWKSFDITPILRDIAAYVVTQR